MTLPQRIALIVKRGLALLHPCVYGELGSKDLAAEIAAALEKEVAMLMPGKDAKALVAQFAARLPEVKRLVETDVQAAYEGDPAATSPMEVVMAYPGLYAVTIYRLAHELYNLKVPIIPRIMSELAHSKTGIDIHPGATIGERFFIDHGTGVVIGETTVIGKNVKLYQGVTLGAKSFQKDPETGALVKGIKRHPNVEDNVVIYAGATILGGDTTIGHDSEIGGSVWLIGSVPPNSRVYNKPPAPEIREKV
ncbi:MAG: serine acetyltransferase [Kiritimatiellae bacterium]|nr:serine acetyltransferase [Kiritimatiellia bacterium]